jgi:prolyl-tRNA editing enzyme YbaK/EbsC (Cys-tRNA(Pro) deacylase)
MALLVRLQELLDRSGVAYTHTVHPLAYTAREVAAAEHLPVQEVAKVVVFLAESGYRMVVLPANKVVDFQELRAMLGFSHARLVVHVRLDDFRQMVSPEVVSLAREAMAHGGW